MSSELAQLKQDAVDKIIFHMTPKEWLKRVGPWMLERGEGALLYDAEGREYLDAMAGGLFAVLAGYGREEIAQAMFEQAMTLNYTSPGSVTSKVTIELARKLAELTPGDLEASFFCNSGSEAVEASIKLARQYHEANGEGRRYKVVSLRRAYHGATVGALSATGWSPHFGAFRRALDPVVPATGYANAMPPYCYHCELGLTHPSCRLACGTTIEQAILGSDPDLVSCVILEPVMGTGGCIVPPAGYLAKVREICDRYGVLLIADEVVCGFGRTGRWFGVNHFDVVPDIMVVAKGLTSGYAPMAAAIVELIAHMPISLRSRGDAKTLDNVRHRLDLIVRTTRKAKSAQQSSRMAGLLSSLSAMPLAKHVTARQRSVNVRVSNVMGPPVPVYLLGARILNILPIMRLFGNVGLVLCAFSYAGQIALVVTADAIAFPDVDVLMDGMERDWEALIGSSSWEATLGKVTTAR